MAIWLLLVYILKFTDLYSCNVQVELMLFYFILLNISYGISL